VPPSLKGQPPLEELDPELVDPELDADFDPELLELELPELLELELPELDDRELVVLPVPPELVPNGWPSELQLVPPLLGQRNVSVGAGSWNWQPARIKSDRRARRMGQ
jgi:hypothetical protein